MMHLPVDAQHVLTQPALLHQLVDGHICFFNGAHCHRLPSAQTCQQCCQMASYVVLLSLLQLKYVAQFNDSDSSNTSAATITNARCVWHKVWTFIPMCWPVCSILVHVAELP